MPANLKRFFAAHIVQSDIDGLYEMRNYIAPAYLSGKKIPGRKIESTDTWLASTEDLESLHDLLCQVLGKPRDLS